uniref:protein-serine/threonine phosphatase n=1 Tax=Anas platyrhynchos TaxID=8839 RepID=A0A8B9SHT3_ANAPL
MRRPRPLPHKLPPPFPSPLSAHAHRTPLNSPSAHAYSPSYPSSKPRPLPHKPRPSHTPPTSRGACALHHRPVPQATPPQTPPLPSPPAHAHSPPAPPPRAPRPGGAPPEALPNRKCRGRKRSAGSGGRRGGRGRAGAQDGGGRGQPPVTGPGAARGGEGGGGEPGGGGGGGGGERRGRRRGARPPSGPAGRGGGGPAGAARSWRSGAGRGGGGGGTMRSQCVLGLRSFGAIAARLWSFLLYVLRRQVRTVIQYQTVRYDVLPLSPVSRNRLSQVKRKILVLDLDETLIHSHHDGVLRPTVRPGTPPDFILKVVIDKHPVRFFVHKRPHVDFFLEVVSQWYELVVFTASMEIYGCAVADKLDNNRSILARRYYRQHCTLELGSYIKDLAVVHSDLSSIVILDNSPGAYRSHPDNAIPIKSWFSDPSDTALLNLLPMLDALRFTADVRSVLSRNLHQHRLW